MKPVTSLPRGQHGVSIISAIFLLLLFQALAVYMLWLTSAQNRGAAQDVQGAQALQAAKAGVEWGLYQLQRSASCASPAGGVALNFAGTSLSSFTASVSCTRTSNTTELSNTVRVYQITATACNQPVGGSCQGIAVGNNGYVERQIQVTTECIPSGDSVTPTCP